VLTIATAVILKFFHLKKSMVRFFTFFFYLSFGVIFAGLLYGSFFGNPFFQIMTNPATGEPKAILDSGVDILMMLILSIAVGVVQVLFGFGSKAYMAFRDGKPGEAFMDSILWIITLVSALGMLVAIALPSFAGIEIPGIIGSIAKWGLIGGLIALLCTQGRSSPSIAGKFGNGLLGVYNITSYAGDFISYTRLAAIALSGAYIASSFNMMAGMIPFPVSIIFGTAIFLVGNALNMGLGLLGAYVHGCRLMFVEFFGKFYEGGGVPFKPFAPKNIYVTLK
jgi:V/A-type H+-transporting ATPase subunit I